MSLYLGNLFKYKNKEKQVGLTSHMVSP